MGAPTWAWISRRVEAKVIERALKHASKIIDVAEASYKLFQEFKAGSADKVKETYNIVHQLEKEADEIKRAILKELSRGFIHPIDREELVRLVLINDDIAAYLKAAARRASLVEPNEITEVIRDYIARMVEKVVESTKLLKKAIEALVNNPVGALELADSVERLEEEVDEIRIEALAEVLKFCDEAKPSACMIAKEIVDSVENSEDRCEDSADVIRSIVVLRT